VWVIQFDLSVLDLLIYCQAGSNVILLARRADALRAVADACVQAHAESGQQRGGQFATLQLDVSDKAQVASLWQKVPSELRDVDVLGQFSRMVDMRVRNL
jgi:3-hydroxy acid dehydrogenase/malonic semialdehyde reductase